MNNVSSNFLVGMSGIMAKLARADGQVSKEEGERVLGFFKQLGLTGSELEICREAFNQAIDDYQTAAYYAKLCAVEGNPETRHLVYSVLWEVAAVDGHLDRGEEQVLQEVLEPLGLSSFAYSYNRRLRLEQFDKDMSVPVALAVLGCEKGDSREKIKTAYQQLVTRYSPEHLDAENVPPSLRAHAATYLTRIHAAMDYLEQQDSFSRSPWKRLLRFLHFNNG